MKEKERLLSRERERARENDREKVRERKEKTEIAGAIFSEAIIGNKKGNVSHLDNLLKLSNKMGETDFHFLRHLHFILE